MKATPLAVAAILGVAVLGLVFSEPLARGAATVCNVDVTVSNGTSTVTKTLHLVSPSGSGTFTVDVTDMQLALIQSTFGTTTFTFPKTYAGTTIQNGVTYTITMASENTCSVVFV